MKIKHLDYKLILLIVFTAILFNSCATTKFTKSRIGKYEYDKSIVYDDLIDVSVTLLPLPPKPTKPKEKPKTFFDLRDSIPNTLLRVLGENTQSADKIIELIKEPLSEIKANGRGSKSDVDFTSFKVRFLFSNIKKLYRNNDLMHDNTRLEYLNTKVVLDHSLSNVKIYSIDKLENELEKIDLGTLERTNDVTFNTKLSAQQSSKVSKGNTLNELIEEAIDNTLSESKVKNVYDEDGNILRTIGSSNTINSNSSSNTTNSNTNSSEFSNGLSGEASYNNSENIKENIQLKKNTIKTGFSFTPKSITIAQRGRPLGGILNNVILTATLKFNHAKSSDVFYFNNLFNTETHQQIEANKINIQKYNIGYNPCNEISDDLDFSFKVEYDGALRAARNRVRGNNIGEFDDRVKFYRISKKDITPEESPKISKFEYCKRVYRIIAYDPDIDRNMNSDEYYILKIDRYGISDFVYLFEDDNPRALEGWINRLVENPNSVNTQTKKFRLYFERNTLDANGNIKKIYLTKENMTSNDFNEIKRLYDITTVELPASK